MINLLSKSTRIFLAHRNIYPRGLTATSNCQVRHESTAKTPDGSNNSEDKSQKKGDPKVTTANRPMSDTGPITWKSLLIGGGTLALLTGYFMYLKRLKQEKIEREKTRTYGKAAIGGSFELVDTEDVCPEELDKLALVVDNLKKANVDIVPLFISVDPERDTPEMVGKYLKEFSDKFIGLTGTKEQVEKATRAYRVYYSAGPRDKDNDYIVDHTIISYLINPKGELTDYFGQTKAAGEIESTILFAMKKYKP